MSSTQQDKASPPRPFDGDASKYFEFDVSVGILLGMAKIGYLRDPTEMQKRTTPPVESPFLRVADVPNKEERDHRNRANSDRYNREKSAFDKYQESLPNDCNTATQIIIKLLDSNMKSKVDPIVNAAGQTLVQKYNALVAFLAANHAPKDEIDVTEIEKVMRSADDTHGFTYFLHVLNKCQATLKRIPKRIGGVFQLNHLGVQEYCDWHPAQMRGLMIEAMQNSTNTHFKHLAAQAVRDPNLYTYERIKTEMENLLKAKYDPKSINVDCNALDEMQLKLRGNGHKGNAALGFGATSSSNQFNPRINICLNCRQEGHYAANCPSHTCGKCGDTFGSATARQKHYKTVCRRTPQNNKRPRSLSPLDRPPTPFKQVKIEESSSATGANQAKHSFDNKKKQSVSTTDKFKKKVSAKSALFAAAQSIMAASQQFADAELSDASAWTEDEQV